MNDLIKRLRAVKYTRERGDGHNGEYYIEPCDADDYGAEATNRNPDGPEAADRLTAMKAAGDGLAGLAVHTKQCPIIKGWGQAGNCTCGLTAAITKWKEASDGL